MQKQNWLRRILSIGLAVLFMFSAFPMAVSSQDEVLSEAAASEAEVSNAAISEAAISEIVREDISKREECVKHFDCADGGTIAVLYAGPVHYQENGQWKDIDNSLVLSENVFNGAMRATYVPRAGALPVSIPLDLADGKKITLSSNGFTVGFAPSAANQGISLQSTATVTAVDALASNISARSNDGSTSNNFAKTQQEVIREYNDEIMALENLSSAVVYKNVFQSTDMEVIVGSTGIKQYLVVDTPQAGYIYYYDIDLGGLVPAAQEDGSILLFEPGNTEEAIFIIHAPYMYDSQGEYSDAVTMTLDNGLLTVDADAGWVNDPGRAWPVVIDPSFTLQGTSAIQDTHVSNSWINVNQNFHSSDNLYAGKLVTGSFNRSYMQFNLPPIPTSSKITAAELTIKKWSSNIGSYPILVYDACYYGYSWSYTGLVWDNQPVSKNANGLANDPNLSLLNNSSVSPTGQFYNINVVDAVTRWYMNNRKNGLILTSVDENANGQAAFHSSNTTLTSEKPVLWFEYFVLNVSPESWVPSQQGGTTSISVTSNTTWTAASSDTSWLTVSPSSGSGNGSFTITAAANNSTASRTGTVTVKTTNNAITRIISVSQEGTTLGVNSPSWSPGIQAANTTINVTSNTSWKVASSDTSWLTVSPASGSGNGPFTITATANGSATERTGTVTVKTDNNAVTREILVSQEGPRLNVDPLSWKPGASAANTTINVTANTTWNATAPLNQNWLSVSSASGSGDGTFTINVTPNANPGGRDGIITVATGNGAIFKEILVDQAGTALHVAPSSWDTGILVASKTIDVTSNTTWNATAPLNQTWLSVSSASGSGNGTFTINVTANNSTTARNGTITVATGSGVIRTVDVHQQGTQLTVTPPTVNQLGVQAANTTINVSSNAAWNVTVTPNQSWLSVSSASGSGNSSFTISVTANNSDTPRTGTVTVQTTNGAKTESIGISQAGIELSADLPKWTAAIQGGTSPVINITSNASWTITSDQGWLTTSRPNGSGNAAFTMNATANTGNQRTGTVTIQAGQVTETIEVLQMDRVDNYFAQMDSSGNITQRNSSTYHHSLATWAMELSKYAYNENGGPPWMLSTGRKVSTELADNGFTGIVTYTEKFFDRTEHTIAHRDIAVSSNSNAQNINNVKGGLDHATALELFSLRPRNVLEYDLGNPSGIFYGSVVSNNRPKNIGFSNVVLRSETSSARPLVVVAIRGSSGLFDWVRNALTAIGPFADLGFIAGLEDVLASLMSGTDNPNCGCSENDCVHRVGYLNYYELQDKAPIFLITGHSHGAAVGNLLAAHLNSCAASSCCNDLWDEEDIYAYTFATPNVDRYISTDYQNIFNICNRNDIITLVPRSMIPLAQLIFEPWGKHGRTVNIAMPMVNGIVCLPGTPDGFIGHHPDIYLDWMKRQSANTTFGQLEALSTSNIGAGLLPLLISLKCPVGATVYDSEGNELAHESTGGPSGMRAPSQGSDDYDSDVVSWVTEEDEKLFFVPYGSDASELRVVANDSGTMTFAIATMDEGLPHELKAFEDVDLYPGKEFLVNLTEESERIAIDAIKLYVAENGVPIGEVDAQGNEFIYCVCGDSSCLDCNTCEYEGCMCPNCCGYPCDCANCTCPDCRFCVCGNCDCVDCCIVPCDCSNCTCLDCRFCECEACDCVDCCIFPCDCGNCNCIDCRFCDCEECDCEDCGCFVLRYRERESALLLQALMNAGLVETDAEGLTEWILELCIPDERKLRRFLEGLEYDELVIEDSIQAFLAIGNQLPGSAFVQALMPLMADSMELWEIEGALYDSGFEHLALVAYYFNQVFNDGNVHGEIEVQLELDLGDANDLAFCEELIEAVAYCYFRYFRRILMGWQGFHIDRTRETELLGQLMLDLGLDAALGEEPADALLAIILGKEALDPENILETAWGYMQELALEVGLEEITEEVVQAAHELLRGWSDSALSISQILGEDLFAIFAEMIVTLTPEGILNGGGYQPEFTGCMAQLHELTYAILLGPVVSFTAAAGELRDEITQWAQELELEGVLGDIDAFLEAVFGCYFENFDEILSAYYPAGSSRGGSAAPAVALARLGFESLPRASVSDIFAGIGNFFRDLFSSDKTTASKPSVRNGESKEARPGFFRRIWNYISSLWQPDS